MVGSPPPWRAAMMMARLSLLHSLPRLASMAPFLCLIVAQWEWPDMASPSQMRVLSEPRTQRSGVSGCLHGRLLRCAACAAQILEFFLDLPITFIRPAAAA